MSRIKVTFRQKQIILMLIENGNVPKTIKDISIELNVSSRTIVRELPFIEKFLFENNLDTTPSCRISNYLKKMGFHNEENIFDLEELVDLLCRLNLKM